MPEDELWVLNEDVPPLSPEGETVVEDDPAFTEECWALAPKNDSYTFGTPVTTRTDVWGLVWRVDFVAKGMDFEPRINRYVCWRNSRGALSDQIAFGQDIAPLRP
jgi:hypothetical protein